MTMRLSLTAAALIALFTAGTAAASPEDALKFLTSTGKTGVAQNVGLDAGKKSEVEGIANDLAAKTGAKVYVVLLKRDEDPEPYGGLYERLQMKGKDVLIASNGTKWEVKAAALDHASKQAAVDRALSQQGQQPIARLRLVTDELGTALANVKHMTWNEFQAANGGRGWSGAKMASEFARYKETGVAPGGPGTAITVQPGTQVTPTSSGHTGLWIFLGVLAAAIVGVVIWRRKSRDANLGAELKEMLRGPEQVLTDVVLNMDGLEDHPRFSQLMDAYSACQGKFDQLKSATPTREAIGRARALNDEANRVRRMFDEAKMAR